MFYIYNRATSAIESNPTRGKHYLKAEYNGCCQSGNDPYAQEV